MYNTKSIEEKSVELCVQLAIDDVLHAQSVSIVKNASWSEKDQHNYCLFRWFLWGDCLLSVKIKLLDNLIERGQE